MADDLQRKIIAKVYSRVSAVVMGICDEGDRVYFGTSNDADILHDLRDEWDAHKIMGEDILSSEQEVAALRVRVKSDADRITTLQAQNRKLVEALRPFALVADEHAIISDDQIIELIEPMRCVTLAEVKMAAFRKARAAIAEAEKGEG